MQSTPIKRFEQRLQEISKEITVRPDDQAEQLQIIFKEQETELLRLRNQVAAKKFDSARKSYQPPVNPHLIDHQETQSLDHQESPTQNIKLNQQKHLSKDQQRKLFAQQRIRIKMLEQELQELKDHIYHQDVEHVQQIQTLQESIASKNMRLKAAESMKVESVHYNEVDKTLVELKLSNYRIENQSVAIRRLEAQLYSLGVTPFTKLKNGDLEDVATPLSNRKEEPETKSHLHPAPPKAEIYTQTEPTDSDKSSQYQKVKTVITQLNSVTLQLLESLQLISPKFAYKINTTTSRHSEKLEFVALGFAHLSECIAMATKEHAHLEKESLEMNRNVKRSQKKLSSILGEIKVHAREQLDDKAAKNLKLNRDVDVVEEEQKFNKFFQADTQNEPSVILLESCEPELQSSVDNSPVKSIPQVGIRI